MAKVAARTSKEYLDILNSGDMLIISNHDVLNYISDLGAAERMPPGANRTRKINKLNKELNVIFGFEPTTSIKPEVIPTQSTTKTIFYLCEHLGENAPTTRYPRRVWVDGQDDHLLDIVVQRCANWDFDMPVDVKLWEKREVTIPGWMNPDDYPTEDISLRWFVEFGGSMEWPESWYRGLNKLSEKEKYAAIKLLNQKSFRSEKRRDIRARIAAWLDGTGELGRWDLQNIRNEYIDRECECESHRIYWSR